MSLNPLPLIGSFLGGIQTYLIVGASVAVVAGSAGTYAGYRWEAGKVAEIKLADAQAQSRAVQVASDARSRQDAVTLASAVNEAKAQAALQTHVITITKEIPRYVTVHADAVTCIPLGLVRLLDATVLQADPASLELAPGQSNDACSPVSATQLAASVIANYGTAIANAEQMTALQAWVIENHKAQEGVK
jgi:hypothetical protein